MLNRHLIAALCFLVLSLLAIQPVLAQENARLRLPTITGVRWTSYNAIAWDRPADLSNINGYYIFSRFSTGDYWGSRFVQPNTRASHTFVGLPTTIKWGQVYVYATPKNPNAYRRGLVAPSSTACHGPCPDPLHDRIDWFPSASGPGSRPGMMVMDQRLNPHTAAPVAMFRNPASERLELWGVVSASKGVPLGEVPGIAMLVEASHPGGELARMSHPASGKPVVVAWLPNSGMIEVSTWYADVLPYQIDKPYIFHIDADDRVTIVAW